MKIFKIAIVQEWNDLGSGVSQNEVDFQILLYLENLTSIQPSPIWAWFSDINSSELIALTAEKTQY